MDHRQSSDDEPLVLEWSARHDECDYEIELVVEDQNWLEISREFDFIGKAALLAIRQQPFKAASQATNMAMKSPHRLAVLLLSNDEAIIELNKTYRGKDKATNILSFPSTEDLLPGEELATVHIGDAIMAYDYVINEAKSEEKQIESHISHLVIHGVLHLLGYDHEDSEDADIMESLEIHLMNQLGLENPYEGEVSMAEDNLNC